jgi:hypothetical protein
VPVEDNTFGVWSVANDELDAHMKGFYTGSAAPDLLAKKISY